MRIRTRLFIAFFVLAGLGFYKLVDWMLDDLRPRYLETMEESMIDTATILSSLLEQDIRQEGISVDSLRDAFTSAQRRKFSAKIYDVVKTHLNMRVYVVGAKGIVVFDSDNGKDEGKDYSQWNDVIRTMRGEYGARATRTNPDDPRTAVLHVASPIRSADKIIGVLTVCKPVDSVTLFLDAARKKTILAGILAALGVALLGVVISIWITSPIQKLTRYARSVRDGERAPPPSLGRSEIGELGAAFEEMRDTLEGKQYAENYVQTLTHEMKAPLSAIQGAAELLEEDMSAEQRQQFLGNIQAEASRMQDLVDRLLELSSLEKRKELRDVEDIDLVASLREVIDSMKPVLSGKGILVIQQCGEPVIVKGEPFLIRQCISNLLQNAVDFSPKEGKIAAAVTKTAAHAELSIVDEGPGLPDYAFDKAFDRFYSLKRPDSGKKSSGLGLTFVREAAALHGGEVTLANCADAGTKATLLLPLVPMANT